MLRNRIRYICAYIGSKLCNWSLFQTLFLFDSRYNAHSVYYFVVSHNNESQNPQITTTKMARRSNDYQTKGLRSLHIGSEDTIRSIQHNNDIVQPFRQY